MVKIVQEFPEEYHKIEKELTSICPSNVFQLIHERTRFIYTKYKNGEISPSLYTFLCLNQYVDIPLTIYWQKQGYERLCCSLCVYSEDKSKEKVCICRVPQRRFQAHEIVECGICKCLGCSGY